MKGAFTSEPAETQDEYLAGERAGGSFEVLDGLCRFAVEGEGDAFDDEPRRICVRRDVAQIVSGFAAGAVVRGSRPRKAVQAWAAAQRAD